MKSLSPIRLSRTGLMLCTVFTLSTTSALGQNRPGDPESLLGTWIAERYVLAGGAEHALRGHILFDRSGWSVLFFVLDEGGQPVRASAEGGTFEVRPDTVVFSHLYHYSSGAALEGLPASELRMTAREEGGPLEPTRFLAMGGTLTLFFPSGNEMRFTRAESPDSRDEAEVVHVVAELFVGLNGGDAEYMRRSLLPGAVFWAVPEDPDAPVRRTTATDFLESLEPDGGLLERFWSPLVHVDGDIAQVWTPYDFHRGGSFSHCGTDAFHLIRRQGVWRVADIMYTVQRQDCPPSPLGSPGSDNGSRTR